MHLKEIFIVLPKKQDLKNKKILIIGPAFPLRGGLATFDERLCKEFNEQGNNCEILSFSLQYPNFLFPGKTQYSTSEAPKGISIFSKINSINPINWIWNGFNLKKEHYDIVIIRYWMSFMAPAFGTIARILSLNKNTKIVAITDNLIPHEKRFFDNTFTNFFLKPIDGFITMSEEVKHQVQLKCPNKPCIFVPHPMYDMFGPLLNKIEAKIALGLDPQINYLLFFGFIRKYKGLQLLLEALSNLDLDKLNLKLIIAGEFYEDSSIYLDKLNELGLMQHVVLRNDFIPDNEVNLYFSACDLVTQTYISATQSGVTQIAFYYDKPMLVTNVGGLAEHIENDIAGYVCAIDAKEIANRIVDFYEKDKEKAFSEGVKMAKIKFTWKYLTENIEKLGELVN